MKNTLQFMISNFSLKRFIIGASIWIIGGLLGVVILKLITGWTSFDATLHTIRDLFLFVVIIACIGAYENTKGRMQGIIDGTSNERKTWRNWYKRHQEEIKDHSIKFHEPTATMLACPYCGGHHD